MKKRSHVFPVNDPSELIRATKLSHLRNFAATHHRRAHLPPSPLPPLLSSSLSITIFSALFSLRNLKGHLPRLALIQATRDSSNLLAHEAAFALGQMQDAEAIPALESILNDFFLHPIVRHERLLEQ
ncbi:hypothetical protein RND81_10G242900 [Saponaria officinalis]|uniref:Uncharacterized protein n=1 Tax=Saponaria officinalis TaxID=3572 RepID=A0AAW1I7Y5_SAPOF